MRPSCSGSASARTSEAARARRGAARRAGLALLALAAAAWLAGPAAVRAADLPKLEPVPIAVIDFHGVLSESEAAKGIRRAVEARRAEYRKKFAAIEKRLRDEQQALSDRRPVLSAEAFQKRAEDLKERTRQAQLEAQAGNRELKKAFDTAMDKVQKALVRVCAKVAEESGASVVLFRSAIVIAVKKLEISRIALERLNETLPAVEVVFEAAGGG